MIRRNAVLVKERDVFLSHNSCDKPVVKELANWLVESGFTVWLDEWNLVPGEPWQGAIESALDKCLTCMVLVGPSGLGPWQHEEMRIAIARRVERQDIRVIPVLLPGASRGDRSHLPAFLSQTTWVEFRHGLNDARSKQRLALAIQGEEPQSVSPESLASAVCPYRGLEAFDVNDAHLFFGREALTGWLLNELAVDPLRVQSNRFLAILGPSGCGKSSVARAGLLAALRQGELGDSSAWAFMITRPGPDPVESLAVTAAGLLSSEPTPERVIELASQFLSERRTLHLVSQLALRNTPPGARTVILIDQFEELFTVCQNEELRRSFIDNVLHAASVFGGRTLVILVMRADFYHHCATYPQLAAAMAEHQVLVGAMNPKEIATAIERPATLCGYRFEPGLVDTLRGEIVGQPGGLPLLQHALLELWRRSRERLMTYEAYSQIGGVAGAVAQRAEDVFSTFSAVEQEICRWILLRLTKLGDDSEDTRRRVSRHELARATPEAAAAVERVLFALSDPQVRLLTLSGALGPSDHGSVEVSHEALIRSWPRLRTWLEEDRAALRFHRKLTEAATLWDREGRETGYLYRGVLLAQVERWKPDKQNELNVTEEAFLYASVSREVDDLERVPVGELPVVLDRLATFSELTKQRLRDLLQIPSLPPSQRRRVVYAMVGLSFGDQLLVEELAEDLLALEPTEVSLFVKALQPYADWLRERFWRITLAGDDRGRSLRAAAALAVLDPTTEKWYEIAETIAHTLARENALHLATWIQVLRPIGKFLTEPLLRLLTDEDARDSLREAAAVSLVTFCSQDTDALARCVSESPTETFELFFSALTSRPVLKNAAEVLEIIVTQQPSAGASQIQRVSLGGRRAGAAIALIRMGMARAALPIFEFREDPEAMTQFIQGTKPRAVDASVLVGLLGETDVEKVQVALLLALGAYDLSDLSTTKTAALIKRLYRMYNDNRHSAVHGAVGWLLRRWGKHRDVRRLDRSLISGGAAEDKEWFVLELGGQPLTFVIFEPCDFTMGSPVEEIGRGRAERSHIVRLTRPYAVADRLVTRSDFRACFGEHEIPDTPVDEWSPTLDHPMVCATWLEAVLFCRWATRHVGMTEGEQAYDVPAPRQTVGGFEPDNAALTLSRPGFRLLTEAEWENACRAGSLTAYGFGNNSSLLDEYAWYVGNCTQRQTHISHTKKPNLRGLFDMHGNVYEWCHDWFGEYDEAEVVVDPIGPAGGPGGVLRGGGYNYRKEDCRSAYRYYTWKANRNARIGFRLALSISS